MLDYSRIQDACLSGKPIPSAVEGVPSLDLVTSGDLTLDVGSLVFESGGESLRVFGLAWDGREPTSGDHRLPRAVEPSWFSQVAGSSE